MNMKKIFITILSIGLLASCYRDKGNYDYTLDNMNEITAITFNPAKTDDNLIEFQQALKEEDRDCRIVVNVTQSKETTLDNLHFYWNISGDKDTIVETTGYLDIKLPLAQDLKYNILLQVYDKTTTLSRYEKLKVQTRPIFKNSLFVLHGKEGERKLGNIEIIAEDTIIYTDAYSKLFPVNENPFANSIALNYSVFHDHSDKYPSDVNSQNMTVWNNDAKASVYEPYGLKVKYSNSAIFRPTSASFKYSRNVQVGSIYYNNFHRVVLSQDGQFYVGNHFPILYKPGYLIETGEAQNEAHQMSYRATAAAITSKRVVVWDEKNDRFLYLKHEMLPQIEDDIISNFFLASPIQNANVNFTSLQKSPAGMKAVYSYTQYIDDFDNTKAYFIFLDESSNEYWRYELTSVEIEDGNGEKANMTRANGEAPAAFTIEGELLSNFDPGEQINTVVYNSWFTSNYLFYANGGTVYRYNVSNGEKHIVYNAPEGYTVSVIKFRNADSSNYMGDLHLYMSIGLNKGEEGAVAEVKFTTASDLDETFPTLFFDKDNEGNIFGNIQDLQFAPIYNYHVEY